MNSPLPSPDTIAALSSGPLPAGIAVVRVSGPQAADAVLTLAGSLPEPRRTVLRTFRDRTGEAIDRGILVFFPGPQTATGEDVAEFHLHGGRAVVSTALAALVSVEGVRLAEAGEFTRRAFVNGRIDLTEAEGLADLLAAETEGQRRQAFRQGHGENRALYEDWSGRLLHARALIEAELDFADEGDVSDNAALDVASAVDRLAAEIERHLEGARRGEIMREGFRVAIVGAPNAGKSSLLNALAQRDAAIVSPVPGTTRDAIEVTLDLGGVPVRLVDTAGLRETTDVVERIGIERSYRAIEEADLVLLLQASDAPPDDMIHVKQHSPVLRVGTKGDLGDVADAALVVSARSGKGLPELVTRIADLARAAAGSGGDVVPTRERHRIRLASTLSALRQAPLANLPPEILAETLRHAAQELGALTGRTDVEDILDLVFSQFCIGK